MAAAFETFCPHLPKSLAFFFLCLSHKLLQTIERTNPDYFTTIVKEKVEETLDFGSQRRLRTEHL